MPHPKVKISDDSGNAVGVTSNRLNVNAYLAATPTIDIGDVSLLLGGTAASVNTGDLTDQTLRVTLARNDLHYGTIGEAADNDGAVHGQLRFIGSKVADTNDKLTTIDLDTSYLPASQYSLAIMEDWDAVHDSAVSSDGAMIMAEAKTIDGSALPNTVAEGDATRLAVSRSGVQYAHLTIADGTKDGIVQDDYAQVVRPGMVNVGGEYRASSTTYSDGDATILQTNVNGALNVSPSPGYSSVGQFTTNIAASATVLDTQACKHADIMAKVGNAGVVYVGGSGVSATTGIALYPGDIYSIDITNTNLLYGIAANANDDLQVVHYT